MAKELSRAIMTRNRLWRKYKRYPGPKTWESYRKQKNKTVAIRRTAIRDHLKLAAIGGTKNKTFWPIFKPYMTNKGSQSSNDLVIQDTEGTLISQPHEVANELNNFYVNIASHIVVGATVSDFGLPWDLLAEIDFLV